MTSKDVPVSQQRLFVGRGFLWEQKHTHRLMQTYRPEFRRYVEPTPAYRLARRLEARLEFAPFPLYRLPTRTGLEHGSESCRGRVCTSWYISVVGVYLKKKQ